MNEEVKAFTGLGFYIYVMDLEDHKDFPCTFHKLDEEQDSHPCLETPYVFMVLNDAEEGISLCGRHFSLFASDMLVAISCMGRGNESIAPTPNMVTVGKGSVVTRPAFSEAFMRAKETLHG